MQEPFDIEIHTTTYSVFPEENNTYTIFKEGEEYMKLQKDTDEQWLRLDLDTDALLFEENDEANRIGKAIAAYLPV